jgi:hypothetical protein
MADFTFINTELSPVPIQLANCYLNSWFTGEISTSDGSSFIKGSSIKGPFYLRRTKCGCNTEYALVHLTSSGVPDVYCLTNKDMYDTVVKNFLRYTMNNVSFNSVA